MRSRPDVLAAPIDADRRDGDFEASGRLTDPANRDSGHDVRDGKCKYQNVTAPAQQAEKRLEMSASAPVRRLNPSDSG